MFRFLKQLFSEKPRSSQGNLVSSRYDDEAMLRFYSKFVGAQDLCFDIGANLGNRLAIFRKLDCRVVALEPQAACFEALLSRFRDDSNVTLVRQAAADQEGELEMQICEASTISSLSKEWIAAVKESGRFKDYSWNKKETISTTTLDLLITKHGLPRFIKVDVEGFEAQVIRGLSQPVPFLSFEWTPEFSDAMRLCLDHLSSIEAVDVNYSLGESMQLANEMWTTPTRMKQILTAKANDRAIFGDVYVRYRCFQQDSDE